MSGINPQPYAELVQAIEISRGDGPLRISMRGKSCRVTGGHEPLQLLVDNVSWLLDSDERGPHLHFEYFPGHVYIHESSEPLILRVSEEESEP